MRLFSWICGEMQFCMIGRLPWVKFWDVNFENWFKCMLNIVLKIYFGFLRYLISGRTPRPLRVPTTTNFSKHFASFHDTISGFFSPNVWWYIFLFCLQSFRYNSASSIATANFNFLLPNDFCRGKFPIYFDWACGTLSVRGPLSSFSFFCQIFL